MEAGAMTTTTNPISIEVTVFAGAGMRGLVCVAESVLATLVVTIAGRPQFQ